MGQVVKRVSEHTTRYYWYPGDKKDWQRAAVAVGAGAVVFTPLLVLTRDVLTATVAGVSVTVGLSGYHLGRRTARVVGDLVAPADRRAVATQVGRAGWRGFVETVGAAGSALLIVHLSPRGVVADWVLPAVPVLVAALGRQVGMVYQRLTDVERTGREAVTRRLPRPPGGVTPPPTDPPGGVTPRPVGGA
ncbi:MAG TPA: hypothetical protein VF054_02095 [Micromonosporaceae bacterium]